MSKCTEGEGDEGSEEDDEERLCMWIPQEVNSLRDLLTLNENDQSSEQVGPHIDAFVVSLEEGEEVVTPALVRLPVASEHVAFPEDLRHVRELDSAGQSGEGRLQQLRDLTELLYIDEQATDLLHHHRRHVELCVEHSV